MLRATIFLSVISKAAQTLCFQDTVPPQTFPQRRGCLHYIHNDQVGIMPILPPPPAGALGRDDLPPDGRFLEAALEAPVLLEPLDAFLYLFLSPLPE